MKISVVFRRHSGIFLLKFLPFRGRSPGLFRLLCVLVHFPCIKCFKVHILHSCQLYSPRQVDQILDMLFFHAEHRDLLLQSLFPVK